MPIIIGMVGTIGKTSNKGKTMNGLDLKNLVKLIQKYVDMLRNTDMCPEETQIFLHDALVSVHGCRKEIANQAIDEWEELPLSVNPLEGLRERDSWPWVYVTREGVAHATPPEDTVFRARKVSPVFFQSIVEKSCNSENNVQ